MLPEPETLDAARFVQTSSSKRPPRRVGEQPVRGVGVALQCASCGAAAQSVRRRMCTGGELLCTPCRASPAHQIMSASSLRKSAPWLSPESYPAHVGLIANCRHPGFRPQRVYAWADVAERCVALGVPLPEYGAFEKYYKQDAHIQPPASSPGVLV